MPRIAVNHEEPGVGFEVPDEYAGHGLLDPTGKRFGSIERVFVNRSGEPEYIRVKTGCSG